MCTKKSNTNASSWDNGSPDYGTGTGLGLRIDQSYQAVIFNSNFNNINLYHNGELIAKNVNVSNKNCRELISKEIGLWLIKNKWHKWPTGQPYRFKISQRNNTNNFDIVYVK
jgi:hypothetical protein